MIEKKNNFIVGLTGKNASGKGSVATILYEIGYQYVSLSDFLRAELKKRGEEENRQTLTSLGQELRRTLGPGALAKLALKEIDSTQNFVVDSIRDPFEVEALASNGNFLLLGIDAPAEVRFSRAQNRGRDECASNLEEFLQTEKKELSNNPSHQQIHLAFEKAHEIIFNDKGVEELKIKIRDCLKKHNFPISDKKS